MPAYLDLPAAGALCDPLCFRIEGWVYLDARHDALEAVEFWLDDRKLGETSFLARRRDVSLALALPLDTRAGFIHLAHVAAPVPLVATLRVRARLRGQSAAGPEPLVTRSLRFIARDYREAPYGTLLDPAMIALHNREHIYSSGPSQAEGSAEVVELLCRYLPAPPCRVLDVGCGLGWYGRQLRAEGYDWLGAEMKAADCAELARAGLPHRQVDGRTLPFADGAFDAAICIEVLEHIPDPRAFLHEIRRVAPRHLLVSVPNVELLSYLHSHLAVPWHMLEADHRNFFTRWSLGALLREFYPHTEILAHALHPLRSAEGTPLYYNLFAVAAGP